MLISENWLREWVDPDLNIGELADTLTMAGLEVKNIAAQKPAFDKVVVAQVLAAESHPHADKLKLCQVSYGKNKPVSVVCGAANVAAGMKVALAQVGASLPGGMKITQSSIRGVESSGMLCSAMELGLAESSDGIMHLDDAATPGEDLAEYLGLDDKVIELELTPNRGDCLGMAGVAREVAALAGARLTGPKFKPVVAITDTRVPIDVEAWKSCPRYVGRIIQGIDTHAATPDWMKEKLRRSGLRPISAVVDITNYVMMELGQPMHAFDLANINGGIIVRYAEVGETLTLLDEKQLKLQADDLLICDHQGPVALAGIMGGLGSGIGDNTTDVLLESAYFAQAHIIGKARRVGMQTDASYRFERGVDPMQQERAIERATRLMIDICGGEPGPVLEAVNKRDLPVKKPVKTRYAQIDKVLGVSIKPALVEKYLARLGCTVERKDTFVKATPPAYRFDLEKEYDLIEEVARLYGYNNIPENTPAGAASDAGRSEALAGVYRLGSFMVDRGYNEAITYSFVDPALQQSFHPDTRAIKLVNPIASNLGEMRLSMAPGLLQALAGNYHRQHRQIRLFEMGNIYFYNKKQRDESHCIGAVSTGFSLPEQWGAENRPLDFYDIKADIESLHALCGGAGILDFVEASEPGFHPGRCARIYIDKQELGMAGQILPSLCQKLDIEQDVYFFQLNLSLLRQGRIPAYAGTSRYPSTRRDLSIIIDKSVSAHDLMAQASAAAGPDLQDLNLFDVYTGKPVDSTKKSVSIGLTFQAPDRTLTEVELDAVCEGILGKLAEKFDAQLRV